MAKQTVLVVNKWLDSDGAEAKSSFLVERKMDDQNLDMVEINADITAILDHAEKISKLEYLGSKLVFALPIDVTGLKTAPNDGSTVREQGAFIFATVLGDSGRRTKARITIPSPLASKLTASGSKFNLAELTDEVNTFKQNVLSMDGRALDVVTETFVRQ